MNRNFRTLIAELTLAIQERRFNDAVKLVGECFQYAGGLMDMLFGGSASIRAEGLTAEDVDALQEAVFECESAPAAAGGFDWTKLIALAKIILDLLAQMPKS